MITERQPVVNSYSNHVPPNHTPKRCIEVTSLEPGLTPGLLATVTVRVGGIVIRGVRVTNQGRGTFVNYPARKIDGDWIELVEIVSPALRAAIAEVVLATVRGAK